MYFIQLKNQPNNTQPAMLLLLLLVLLLWVQHNGAREKKIGQ